MPVSFSKEEAHAYLDSRPGWMMLTTVGQDGYPHTVPVGYFRVGDELFTAGDRRRSGSRISCATRR